MLNFKYNPFAKTVYFLSILALAAIAVNLWNNSDPNPIPYLLHLVTTVGFAIPLFYLFQKLSGKKKELKNTIITTLIIFLILHYGISDLNYVTTLIATFVAVFSKFYLEPRSMPIVNPAVLGILVAAGISYLIPSLGNPLVSWWGASFMGYFSLIIIALWVLFGFSKWRKWPLFITFIIAQAVFFAIRGESLNGLIGIFTDSTIYFLATIMLADPKTSPILKSQQVIFALIAAASYNFFLHFGLPYFDMLAIALANLGFALMRFLKMKSAAQSATQK